MLLMAARTSETVGARWDEINMAAKVWTVPAELVKAGRWNRVPLCNGDVDILKTMNAT